MQKRKLMVFIATSLDGYIATPEGSIDFLKIVQKEGEDYGYSKFKETVDTIMILKFLIYLNFKCFHIKI